MLIKYGTSTARDKFNRIIFYYKSKLKLKYKRIIHFSGIPANYRNSDVFLVEYPRSGVTWLSFLLGNVNMIMSGKQTVMTFFNSFQYVPDVHFCKEMDNSILKYPGFRIIKSHNYYNPFYNFVIYLIRNPFNVMQSHYNLYTHNIDYTIPFKDFVSSSEHGIQRWIAHVKSWTKERHYNQKIIYLKYEDLRKNTAMELKKIYSNLGLEIKNDVLEKAIKRSSIENMKKSENLYRKASPSYKINFINEGGLAPDTIDNNCKEYIYLQSKNMLEKYYPELI